MSAGRTAGDGLYLELAEAGVPVERAGDCLGPRSFEEAIREGTLAGLRGVNHRGHDLASAGLDVAGRAEPRSMGSIGVQTASSPQPGQ